MKLFDDTCRYRYRKAYYTVRAYNSLLSYTVVIENFPEKVTFTEKE